MCLKHAGSEVFMRYRGAVAGQTNELELRTQQKYQGQAQVLRCLKEWISQDINMADIGKMAWGEMGLDYTPGGSQTSMKRKIIWKRVAFLCCDKTLWLRHL